MWFPKVGGIELIGVNEWDGVKDSDSTKEFKVEFDPSLHELHGFPFSVSLLDKNVDRPLLVSGGHEVTAGFLLKGDGFQLENPILSKSFCPLLYPTINPSFSITLVM